MAFGTEARKRRERKECVCWDCLRAAGLTPPIGLRESHKTVAGEVGQGDPAPFPYKRRGAKQPRAISAEDNEHLRAAIRNREAI